MIHLFSQLPDCENEPGLLRHVAKITAPLLPSATVLEVGCGGGWFLKYALSKDVKKIIGIDVNIDHLKNTKLLPSNPKLELVAQKEFAYGKNQFQLAVAWEVLEHLEKNCEEIFFKSVADSLVPGGIFFMSTPYASLRSMLTDPAWWLISHRHYKKQAIENYAKLAGLEIESISVYGGWAQIFAAWDLYISKWIFRMPPLLVNFYSKKLNKEYQKPGFMTIVAKFKKL